MSLFRKKKPNKLAIRTWKLKLESLTETERDFVMLILDGGRTYSPLRRRNLEPNDLAEQLRRKGIKFAISKTFDPIITINKEI